MLYPPGRNEGTLHWVAMRKEMGRIEQARTFTWHKWDKARIPKCWDSSQMWKYIKYYVGHVGSENRMCMPSVSVRFLLHAIPVAYRKKNYMWFPTAGRVGRQRGNLGAVTRQCERLFFDKISIQHGICKAVTGKNTEGKFYTYTRTQDT